MLKKIEEGIKKVGIFLEGRFKKIIEGNSLKNPLKKGAVTLWIFIKQSVRGIFLGLRTLMGYFWRLSRPRKILIALALLILILLGSRHRVDQRVSLHVDSPTNDLKTYEGHPLRFQFSADVAALDTIGKEVDSQVRVSPPLEGKWMWESASSLLFTPKKPWVAGEKYKVRFGKTLFVHGAKLKTRYPEFSTEPFRASSIETSLYHLPTTPSVQQVSVEIIFNYPVDRETVEQNLHLDRLRKKTFRTAKEPLKFTLGYNEDPTKVTLVSEAVPIEEKSYEVQVSLKKGIRTTFSSKTGGYLIPQIHKLTVPSARDFFKVKDISTQIAFNEEKDDEPQQVMDISFSYGVEHEALKQSLEVYLLPQKNEKGEEYHWDKIKGDEVGKKILANSEKLELGDAGAPDPEKTHHFFLYHVGDKEARYVFVKIQRGLKSTASFQLDEGLQTILKVPPYGKSVHIMGGGVIVSSSGDKKISYYTRGIKNVVVEVGRIREDQVGNLVSQSRGDLKNIVFNNSQFSVNNIAEFFTESATMASDDPRQASYGHVDLSKYLRGKEGVFFLKISEKKKSPWAADTATDSRYLILSDFGIVVKDNRDGSHEMFVMSFRTGKPLEGVSVGVMGLNGLEIFSEKTDREGHVHIANYYDFTKEKRVIAYTLRKGEGYSFFPSDGRAGWLNYSRFDVGGEYSYDIRGIRAHLFTDRGLYRPGEVVHFSGIVKKNDWKPMGGLPLKMVVYSPNGEEVFSEKFTLSKEGIFENALALDAAVKTGQYNLSLSEIKDDGENYLGNASFDVEEFLPDKMRIRAKMATDDPKGWITSKKVEATVQLENLFGEAAVGHRVEASVRLLPRQFHFDQFKDYVFRDPFENKALKSQEVALPATYTDDNGKVRYPVDLSPYEEGSYLVRFTSKGFEKTGGRNVVSQDEVLFSPLEVLVGYKSDGDLNYVYKGAQREVHFIALDSQLNKKGLSGLTYKLIRHAYEKTLVSEAGKFVYRLVERKEVAEEKGFDLASGEASQKLRTTESGKFSLLLEDKDGKTLVEVPYTVVGTSNRNALVDREGTLTLLLNKKTYRRGEAIEMQITAPYKGAGLITIERDKVYAHKWFHADTTSVRQTLVLPRDIEGGNAYVNVSFARSMNDPEVYTNPHSFGVAGFAIDRSDRRLNLDLDAPKRVKPGHTLTIRYRSEEPSKMIVFAVDEGILSVSGYEAPDPMAFFFKKGALEIGSSQNLDSILPDYQVLKEASGFGGGLSPMKLSGNINPFRKQDLKPAIYWSGIVVGDSSWRPLSFKIPDHFNGSLRLMAMGVNERKVGFSSTNTLSRADIIMTPSLPDTVSPGDVFEVGLSVRNDVEGAVKETPIQITLEAPSAFEVLGSRQLTLKIDRGSEVQCRFKLKSLEKLGSFTLKWIAASSGVEPVVMTRALIVRPLSLYETVLIHGKLPRSGGSIEHFNPAIYEEQSTREVFASSSPMVMLSAISAKLLASPPYSNTEALISRVFPAVLGVPLLKAHGEKSLAELVKTLSSRQLSIGGFSMWAGGVVADPFVTVYGAHFLTEAAAVGYTYPSELLSRALLWVDNFTDGEVTQDNVQPMAYGVYVLTRNGVVTTNKLSHLEDFLQRNKQNLVNKMACAYVGASYKLLKEDERGEQWMDEYELSKKFTWYGSFYNSTANDAQYLYLLASAFPQRLSGVSYGDFERILFSAGEEEKWNTLTASYVLLGLSKVDQNRGFGLRDETLSIQEKDDKGIVKALTLEKNPYPHGVFGSGAKTLILSGDGASGVGGLFYAVNVSGFPKQIQKDVARGIELHREYQDSEGNIVTDGRVGDEVTVKVYLRTQNGSVPNVVVVDLLPGGFEVIKGSVEGGNLDYYEVREDRVVSYLTLHSKVVSMSYKATLTSKGRFSIPLIQAKAMYSGEMAQNATGIFEVQ